MASGTRWTGTRRIRASLFISLQEAVECLQPSQAISLPSTLVIRWEIGRDRGGAAGRDCCTQVRAALTWYFPLAPRRVPSLSQVTMGLGFPKAVHVMVILPPSLASIYWGGVSVKVGGAAKDTRKVRGDFHAAVQSSATCKDRGKKTAETTLPPVYQRWGDLGPTSALQV